MFGRKWKQKKHTKHQEYAARNVEGELEEKLILSGRLKTRASDAIRA